MPEVCECTSSRPAEAKANTANAAGHSGHSFVSQSISGWWSWCNFERARWEIRGLRLGASTVRTQSQSYAVLHWGKPDLAVPPSLAEYNATSSQAKIVINICFIISPAGVLTATHMFWAMMAIVLFSGQTWDTPNIYSLNVLKCSGCHGLYSQLLSEQSIQGLIS